MKLFVTGGSRGIGKRIVTMALERGNDVAFTYNSTTNIQEMLDECKKIAPKSLCKGYKLNVRNHDDVVKVTDKVLEDFDHIDTVVNNAAINRNNLAFSMTDEEWHDVIDTNLN